MLRNCVFGTYRAPQPELISFQQRPRSYNHPNCAVQVRLDADDREEIMAPKAGAVLARF
jgi:hypothetical protein